MQETKMEVRAGKRFKFWPFRFLVQLASLLAINGLILTKLNPNLNLPNVPIVLPVLSSFNSPNTLVINVLDAMQVLLSQPEFPWIPLAVLFLICAVIGRAFCGWVCPMGFVQDVISQFSKSQKNPSPRTHSQMSYLKFLILAVILVVSISLWASQSAGLPGGAEYKKALGPYASGISIPVSPEETLFHTVPELIVAATDPTQRSPLVPAATGSIWDILTYLQSLLALKIFVLGVFLYGAYKIPRFWCRYFCPLGASMAILNKFSFLGLRRDPLRCPKCPHAEKACPMQIKILDLPWEKFNDRECIFCMECVDACPHGSLRIKFP